MVTPPRPALWRCTHTDPEAFAAERWARRPLLARAEDTGESFADLLSLDEPGGEMLNVTIAGQMPKVTVGTAVGLVELEAIPWATNGKNGVAFRARQINTLGAAKAA